MTPLMRIDVTGPGACALLQRLTTNDVDKPVGRVVYTLLLEPSGGVRSDLTVARLGEQRFRVGANSPLDLDRLRRAAGPDVQVTDVTDGTCGVGLWGPAARDVLAALTSADVSHAGFGYFHAREIEVAGVPVTALRLSYVGELGWELYTAADLGLRLWDALWAAGQEHGIIAAGRSAFTSLRLEKGYRSAGHDMTTEHDPYAAGLGFAVRARRVRRQRGDRRVGAARPPARAAAARRQSDVVMGKEPVFHDGVPVGYVTSAAYGYTIGASIAYAWLPAGLTAPGTPVEVEYFGARLPAVTAEEPLFDPEMKKIRC